MVQKNVSVYKRLVSSWGRLSASPHYVDVLDQPETIKQRVLATDRLGLAYGMGRSYGDVCLNPEGALWLTSGLNHLIAFDEINGLLTCEAGVLLRDIQRLFVPRGFILPVTPGTQMITIGGAIANDVHGKNHHLLGSFGDHVEGLTLLRTNGEVIECGRYQNSDWLAATIGGLGLTGIITQAVIRLRRVPSPWLATQTLPYENLSEFFQIADDTEANWEHSVSWIDCISDMGSSGSNGRGIFMRGNPVNLQKPEPKLRTKTMPFVPPFSLVNRFSLRPFNMAYYHLQKARAGRAITHYEAFFYPLDNLLEWNRMYGPKGFYQYQSVVPRKDGKEAVAAMLKEITQSGEGSFLAVLKTFGNRPSVGMLSFPQPGVTLALDFPNHGENTLKLFARLDAIVQEAGGRLYPAKDARMPRALFEAGYPQLHEFMKYKDPKISSALSRRLMGK